MRFLSNPIPVAILVRITEHSTLYDAEQILAHRLELYSHMDHQMQVFYFRRRISFSPNIKF